MQHMQRDWYWVIALVLFFIEREVIVDITMFLLYLIYNVAF